MSKPISARSIIFTVNEADVDILAANLESWVSSRNIENALISNDGECILSSSQSINLNSGMLTIARALKLEDAPTRITSFKHLPRDYILHKFPKGYDADQIKMTIGSKFQEASIRSTVQRAIQWGTNKVTNNVKMLSTSTVVAAGAESVLNPRRSVEESKQYVDRWACNETNKKQPDMKHGSFEDMTFSRWTDNKGRDPSTEMTVRITSWRGDPETKRRHYYIYSLEPPHNWKNDAMKTFAECYNVAFVSDIENWANVPRTAQFLIFNENDCIRNLPISQLKTFMDGATQGVLSGRYMSCSAYAPRYDGQLIILSNISPYEVYGKHNGKVNRRFIPATTAHQLEEHFHIFRLDGSKDDDRHTHMSPELWTEREFISECDRLVVATCRRLPAPVITATDAEMAELGEYMAKRMAAPETCVHTLCQLVDDVLGLLRVRMGRSFISNGEALCALAKCGRTTVPLPKVYLETYDASGAKMKGIRYREGVAKLAAQYDCGDWAHIERVIDGPPTAKRPRMYSESDVRELLAFAFQKEELLDTFLQDRSVLPPTL